MQEDKGSIRALLLGLALLLSSCGPDRVAPPPPRAAGTWTDTLPPVPESYLAGPVRYHLGPAMAWLDTTIPPRLGDLERRRTSPDDERLSYAYELVRDSFLLTVARRSATLRTDVAYRVRAWYNPPVLPEVSASCGLEGDPPRARVAVTMDVGLARDWRLHPRTRAEVEPLSAADGDKCTITALEIDVTDDVVKAARAALQDKADEIGARLAAVDLPGEAGRIWTALQQPVRIADSLWLTMNPSAARVGVLELRGDTLRTMVGLTGRPRVTAGPRPAPSARPLPPFRDLTAREPALHLLTEARLPYEAAGVILTRELRGTKIKAAGQQLTLDSLTLAGLGDGRAAVGIGVSGPVTGFLYLVGHPAYDSATARLFMPDLEFDIATRNALTGSLAWLADGAVERYLRQNVRVDLGPTLAEGRRLLEQSLNRELAEGVRLRADIQGGQVHDIRAAPEALLVRAVVSGRAEIVLEPTLEALSGQNRAAAAR
ncbi:MAG TPA: DUF4403 family protein [Gemmatimonadales bacterium]